MIIKFKILPVTWYVTFLCCMALAAPTLAADAPPSSSHILWGASANEDHPDRITSPYNKLFLDQQLRLLKTMGLNGIRTGCLDSNCDQLISLAKKYNIVFLRVVGSWPDAKLSEENNYLKGYNEAFAVASKYRGKHKYYEASNELENWVGMNGNGDDIKQYNYQKYILARAFLKGLIAGVHAGDPAAKVMVNDAGWCHYGFMNELWKDGVRWDITAMHWYESAGDVEHAGCYGANVVEIHASYGKPIWFTEFNSDNSSKKADEEGQAEWLAGFMTQIKQIAPKYNIQAAFVFELMDEAFWGNQESHYGLADSHGRLKPAIAKTIPHIVTAE